MPWVLSETARAASERVPSREFAYDGAGEWVDPCVPIANPPEHMLRLIALMRRHAPWIRSVDPMRRCERDARTGGLSMHATGRAADVMVPVISGPEGLELANWLVQNAKPLGVQLVIWDHAAWQGSRPIAQRFSPYRPTMLDPSKAHTNHVHVELTTQPGPLLDPVNLPPIAPQLMAFIRAVIVPAMTPTPAPATSSSSSSSSAVPWIFAALGTALVTRHAGGARGAAFGAAAAAALLFSRTSPATSTRAPRPMRY